MLYLGACSWASINSVCLSYPSWAFSAWGIPKLSYYLGLPSLCFHGSWHVQVVNPSFNRGRALRDIMSPIYHAAPSSCPGWSRPNHTSTREDTPNTVWHGCHLFVGFQGICSCYGSTIPSFLTTFSLLVIIWAHMRSQGRCCRSWWCGLWMLGYSMSLM